jgi:opacity protein-like surface antigen
MFIRKYSMKGAQNMKKALIMMVLLAMTLIATPAMAKEGLFIGAYVMPSVTIQGDDGSGYGFRAGLGLGKYFSIQGQIDKSELDAAGGGTIDLNGMAVDLRVNFPLTTLDRAKVMSLEPYVQIGYGLNYEVKFAGSSSEGNGPRIGFGIEQYLFRELSINVGYTSTEISFDEPVNEDVRIRTIEIGLTYHFL